MKVHVSKPTTLCNGSKQKMIPIFNDDPDGYTLWVVYDEQAPAQSLAYAEKVASILNLSVGGVGGGQAGGEGR